MQLNTETSLVMRMPDKEFRCHIQYSYSQKKKNRLEKILVCDIYQKKQATTCCSTCNFVEMTIEGQIYTVRQDCFSLTHTLYLFLPLSLPVSVCLSGALSLSIFLSFVYVDLRQITV